MVMNSRMKQQQKDDVASFSSPTSLASDLGNPEEGGYEPQTGGSAVDNKSESGMSNLTSKNAEVHCSTIQ